MKMPSLFLSALLAVAAPLHAQSLPGDSVYHLPAATQDADGHPVAWSTLRGQARVASMFYTHCHLMCPLILENAKSVQKQLTPDERRRLGVVMVSLDPARDTPAAMREVAQRHRVPEGWRFLTPAENDVRAIASVLDVRYRFRDDGSINHTSVLVLLDAEGRIRARSEVNGAAADPAFLIQIKALLAGP
ncbi:SCO family protein [Pseudoxanthomonas sp. LjRoot143]|uniref:SCO family protein n=1 Tax=Pseudoxanthomonas sp. LjRoot143 TaxID=3342266 RepID=UPI003ECEAD04